MDNQNKNHDIEVILPDERNEEIPPHSEHRRNRETHSEEHHHHHHSHRHHRHYHSSKKFKLTPKIAWRISTWLLAVLVVLVIVFEWMGMHPEQDPWQNGELSSGLLTVEIVNPEGLLIKNTVNKYLLTDLLNSYNTNVIPSSFADGDGRLDEQVPVMLKLSIKEGNALSYKIELADNESFFNAVVSHLNAPSGSHSFEHLYANTTYYYRVTVYTSKGADSLTGHFKTADTPRILSIEGLSNVRDIGNWRTDNGKRIKQGLLYRGSEMDGAVESKYHLTNEGLIDMLDVLEIKTDIDLRAQNPRCQDALGACVDHRYYDMVSYDAIFTEAGKEKVRMVFSDLADPDNYPVYLHDTYGNDQTGTICYLLEAVLGVSRGDCLRDYGLSDLPISKIMIVEEGLKTYGGSTLKEQAEAYLLSCGLSEYQIESIRNIFLAD